MFSSYRLRRWSPPPWPVVAQLATEGNTTVACEQIATSVSPASAVYYPGTLPYPRGVTHWASSSSQNATCSFEPGTAEDLGIALQIIGALRTPFAVKGGGHTTNPGFSSTTGIQIAMFRFSDVVYDSQAQTATIGAGLTWDAVYAALEPHAVNVVGARGPGVGVSGLCLGGGYSYLTNQYGLTIDTVETYELVTPDGNVKNVSKESDADLFFGLRGGLNNFGIVTRFTLQTFPQTQVWGGFISYTPDQVEKVNQATADFAANTTDPKAALLITYDYFASRKSLAPSALIFYNAPTPPPGVFDEFLAIPALVTNLTTLSFSALIKTSMANATYGSRAIFNTISGLEYSKSFLDTIVNETTFWGKSLDAEFVSYVVEPFLPSLYTHASSSAFPPTRSKGITPLKIYYSWANETSDDSMHDAARQSASTLSAQSGVSDAARYPNYAMYDTPLESIYGHNVARLRDLKTQVDPTNVMGLAGGFKF
ncbi:FAD-binding domain-containing protein [Melanogaster broomeanus]|nr:FAD-binding domain-containing protein [Melanogaster broomeanus]